MKVKTFYRQSRCKKIAGFEKLIYEGGRRTVLSKATKLVCSMLMAGKDHNSILNEICRFLRSAYQDLEVSFSWQKNQYMYDTMLYKRMLLYLQENFVSVDASLKSTQVNVSAILPDGSSLLEGMVHLIMRDEKGMYHAFIIHSGTCSRSIRGKTEHTAAATDLHCMVAKYTLEKAYPNIVIHPLYLTHKTDTPVVIKNCLEVSDYATSNVHSLAYKDFYLNDGEIFDYDTFRQLMEHIISNVSENSCYGCSWEPLCKTPKLEDVSLSSGNLSGSSVYGNEVTPEEARGYQMPNYTNEQLRVVRHKDGALRVCAGPGSGKTATLIGRIRYLIEECKVYPSFILVVTFTQKAAQELKERCLSFLDEGSLPNISTLNSFCYQVLKDNEDLLGKNLKVLSKSEKLRIIKNLVSVMPPLSGFKYPSEKDMEYGQNGLYQTICSRLDCLYESGEDAFFQKYPTLGKDFIAFATMYKEVIAGQDYISFDEQISLCNELFSSHPEVLSIYSSIYKYVMVDEYQDVNAEQVTMLYSLASHGNIVVVGDDDQSIYGFRGASAKFMQDFTKQFPNAGTVVLNENFRSTKSLVDAAQSLIGNNKERIEKNVRSGSGKEGLLPMVIPSLEPECVDKLIEQLLHEGYSYGDIAILSSKNAPLEELHTSLKAPTILAKSYLREDGFFIFVHTVLQLFYEQMNHDKAFYQYMCLLGKEALISKTPGKTLYEATMEFHKLPDLRVEPVCGCDGVLGGAFSLLEDMFALLEGDPKLSVFLTICTDVVRWGVSNSPEVLLEQIKNQNVASLKDLRLFMDYLVNFRDETRVEVVSEGKVTLITCHDAKGKEFPVVLVRNDYTSFTEEVRRLFYVAVTRAKERLYVLQDSSCKVNFLNEIPHINKEVRDEEKEK